MPVVFQSRILLNQGRRNPLRAAGANRLNRVFCHVLLIFLVNVSTIIVVITIMWTKKKCESPNEPDITDFKELVHLALIYASLPFPPVKMGGGGYHLCSQFRHLLTRLSFLNMTSYDIKSQSQVFNVVSCLNHCHQPEDVKRITKC